MREHFEPSNQTARQSFLFTLKSWPVIATATILLCYLTQTVAEWFGVHLPDQKNIEVVKKLAGFNWAFVSVCFQVLVVMPALEEIYFRYLIYRRSLAPLTKRTLLTALAPTAVFCAILCVWLLHYDLAARYGHQMPKATVAIIAASVALAAEYVVRVFLGRLLAKLSPYAAMAGASVLFSAAHYLAQPFPDSAFIALFFFGFAQCLLYAKTERLWCSVLNHSLFNLTNLVLLFILPEA